MTLPGLMRQVSNATSGRSRVCYGKDTMKVNCEWMDTPELFELVSEAMFNGEADSDGRIDVQAREEPDGYGGSGYIEVKHDGRRFRLELAEIVQ